jgi:hypothetical protein
MTHLKRLASGLLSCFCILSVSQSVWANNLVTTVQGNKVEAVISLPGNITADFTIQFEETIGLTQSSIGISAELINITDQNLLNRLPDLANISLVSEFPMLITVEPPSSQGFSFSGIAAVDIHTHNLEYVAGTPLRFFKAPVGGNFEDITMTMGSGSYRARGTTGKFSQFIIVADLRTPIAVIDTKFDRLNDKLQQFSSQITTDLFADLSSQLNQINVFINQADYKSASESVTEFIRTLETEQGNGLANVWRSSRDVDNVAGELIAEANTLRFSLRLIN